MTTISCLPEDMADLPGSDVRFDLYSNSRIGSRGRVGDLVPGRLRRQGLPALFGAGNLAGVDLRKLVAQASLALLVHLPRFILLAGHRARCNGRSGRLLHQPAFEAGAQTLDRDWFRQMVLHTRLEALLDIVGIGVGGDCDDRQLVRGEAVGP